jgi:hypothetical protein
MPSNKRVDGNLAARKLRAMTLRAALLLTLLVATAAHSQDYRAPRTAFGMPDLQGVWDNDSMTWLQRTKDFKALIASPYEAAAFERKRYGRYEKVIAPVDPEEPAPADGKVEDDDRFEAPRGLARIRGEIRSSQIVDPENGRLPYTAAARAAAEKALKDEEIYNDPEGRPFDERCLLGGGGGVAPPIMNRNIVKIVQTRDHVVLYGEDNHEARIIPLGSRRHLHPAIRPWMGDPVGWWEGDTLVIETTKLSPNDHWRWNAADWIMLTSDARITERITRISPTELLYSYAVEDPGAYTQTWRGEMPFHATQARTFEFACHEGNYALTNILAGARAQERETAAKAVKP